MEALKSRIPIVNFIDKIVHDNGIDDYVIADVTTNQKGEGYLGEIFMVTIKNGEKKLDMVVKAAFINEKVREMAPIRLSFQNETYFYSVVYPRYHQMDLDAGIESREYVPKCFKVRTEEQEEMLALENLRISGFDVFDKKKVLDHDHIKLIFETYGRVHAYSFVLKDQNPEEYKKLTAGLFNVYGEFMKKSFFGDHLTAVTNFVETCLVPGEDNDIIEKFKDYADGKIVGIFYDSATQNDEWTCILHGDCWSNNMMFKYDDSKDRKPIEIRLIDWQIIKEGSPVCDLSYCLYSGADKEAFDNLNEYLKIYHNSFSHFVKKLGCDPEKLYPFSALKAQWKRYGKFGMIMAFSILRMKLTQKEDLIDLTDDINLDNMTESFSKMRFSEDDYKRRMRELLVHMYREDAM